MNNCAKNDSKYHFNKRKKDTVTAPTHNIASLTHSITIDTSPNEYSTASKFLLVKKLKIEFTPVSTFYLIIEISTGSKYIVSKQLESY